MIPKEEIKQKIKELEQERDWIKSFVNLTYNNKGLRNIALHKLSIYDLQIDNLKWVIDEFLPF